MQGPFPCEVSNDITFDTELHPLSKFREGEESGFFFSSSHLSKLVAHKQRKTQAPVIKNVLMINV